jgi:hypothetical protein
MTTFEFLPVHFAHDDVDAPDDGGDVGEEDVFAEFVGDGEVDEAGASDLDAVGDGAALGFDEKA